MEAPNHGGIEIVAYPFKHGVRDFDFGDRFDRTSLKTPMDDRLHGILRRQQRVVPLTRENYAQAMVRRQPGEVGRGFTGAELVKLGILDEAPPASKKARAVPQPTDPMKAVDLGDGYFAQPRKAGVALQYDLVDTDGELLHPKRFRNLERMREHIVEMEAAKAKAAGSTATPASATPERATESTDDVHLQREPEHSD